MTSPQDLANTALAFAKAVHVDADFFSALASAASRSLPRSNAQDLVNTAWAFAKAGQASANRGLLTAIARALITRRPETPRDRPEMRRDAISRGVLADELSTAHIANVAWCETALSPPLVPQV